MKVYFLLIFVALWAPYALGNNEADCSRYEDGESLPDRTSCSRYYLCVGGMALRKQCARGLYFDVHAGLCNMAFLVDCDINRSGGNGEMHHGGQYEVDNPEANPEPPQGHAASTTAAPCSESTTSSTCSTTTTTTCTTTTTTKTTTTTTKTTTTKTTTTTESTCSTTTSTTTKTATTKDTTTKTTTTKTTKTTATTPCSTTTTCSTTSTCSTTTTCSTTQAPCSESPANNGTSSGSNNTTNTSDDTSPHGSLKYLNTFKDCENYPDKTILLDRRHCRRHYVCTNKRLKRVSCPSIREWFDPKTLKCLPRAQVKCDANRN